MKLSTILFVVQSVDAVGSQPDGSALLQLRKLSVLSANNVSRSCLPAYGSCDRDDLAIRIENLEKEKQSKQSTVDGARSELALRESLLKNQKGKISRSQDHLVEIQAMLVERQTEVTGITTDIDRSTKELTSYKEQRVVKAAALQDAEGAVLSAENAQNDIFTALQYAGMSWHTKNQAQIAQKTVVEAAKTSVSNAKTALDNGENAASEQCAAAANLRAEATVAASEHAAAVAQLKKATDQYDAAAKARDQRESEKRAALRNLDDANAHRALAINQKIKQCKEATAADLAEDSAQGKYQAKMKLCKAMEAEEQELIKLQTAAQNAYDAASREASTACGANGLAEKAFAMAQAVYDASSRRLVDAKRSQAAAVARETAECKIAADAHEVVLASKSQLVQAEANLRKAKFADDSATNALTMAFAQEGLKCDAADKAKCAMNKAKGLSDAAKERFDAATAKRESQDAVVKVKEAALESLKTQVEEAQAKVTAAEAHHSETAKVKGFAMITQLTAMRDLKGKKWKVSLAILGQGRAKADYDTAFSAHSCVTARYTTASETFKKASTLLAEKEDTKHICEEDVEATKEPVKARELLDKLQVAYDAVEISLGVWNEAKAKMEALKKELDAKTLNMQVRSTEYEKKKKITAGFIVERKGAQDAEDKAVAQYKAACKANSEAYDHMVELQEALRILVNYYNAAVDGRNKAVQVQADLVLAEISARRQYEFALEYWKKKVSEHDSKKGECEAAVSARETAEATQDGTASALASALALVSSIETRLTIETRTWTTAQAHCSGASDNRAERDALVVDAETVQSDLETSLNQAKTAAQQAMVNKKEAFNKKDAAKLKLGKAVADATKKTAESVKCDADEELLRLAWVAADETMANEQKQCEAACKALTVANVAALSAQTASDGAIEDYENADTLVTSTEATKNSATRAEASAKEDAAAAASLADANEQQCSKLTAEAQTLKLEWEAAVKNLSDQEASASQMQAAVEAAKAALDDALSNRVDALRAVGAAKDAALVAKNALDAVDVCIDTLQKTLARLDVDLADAEGAVADATGLVEAQTAKIADEQSLLPSYESAVTHVRSQLDGAEASLNLVLVDLKGAETALESCPEARCEPPQQAVPNYDGTRRVPNLVDGATWIPDCDSGYKVEYCNTAEDCGLDATAMTCTAGVLSPPSFRCAPILSGTLMVSVIEGRKLEFGEGRFGVSTGFMFHAVASDPFVRVEACAGGSNPQTQETSIKKNSYDAVWKDEPPLSFRINEACSTFRISVRDDRVDDDNLSCMEASEYLGGTEALTVVKGNPLESFMPQPYMEHHRRIISRSGGVVDFIYTWSPDYDGPVAY